MKKIAIIGASYLQLPLVLKARQIGIETHCFAWPEAAVCKDISDFFYPISILEKELILEKCKGISIDGITTIATDMAVPTICYVAEQLNLNSNSFSSSIATTNKCAMRTAFVKGSCSIPKFIKVVNSTERINGIPFPVIVKPSDRSGSRGVTKIDKKEDLELAIEKALQESFEKTALVEQFIEGVEVSVEAISWNGKHTILAITDKITTNAPCFVELAHHQPSQLSEEVLIKIKEETIKCLNALEIKFGASHSEFKITKKGEVYVIEVGARMGGDFIGSHLVPLSTGYDFLKGVIDVALNQFEEPKITKKMYAGVYFLSKETEKILPYFSQDNIFDVQKDIQNTTLQNITNSNDRSGYLIYQSNKRIKLL
ncbi:ATP-grasp domain-containing protein [Flavobacterium sp.]|uniref:ATP-grasp domain-containing protein n=1 Tax=Flavobacterium sp. TaxID=239 RepID=UPI004048CF62